MTTLYAVKHGPTAVVHSEMPVVTIAPSNQLGDKLKNTRQEAKARGSELSA